MSGTGRAGGTGEADHGSWFPGAPLRTVKHTPARPPGAHMIRPAILTVAAVAAAASLAAALTCSQPPPASNFVLPKFYGTWYEIGRIQTPGDRHTPVCLCALVCGLPRAWRRTTFDLAPVMQSLVCGTCRRRPHPKRVRVHTAGVHPA